MPSSPLSDTASLPHARTGAWSPAGLTAFLLAAAFALRIALMLASGAGLHVDEAQYWDWSRHMAWGFWSKPPGIAAIIATSTALFGDGVLGVRLLGMACWPLAGAAVYALGRSMGGAWVGAWAAVLFIGSLAAGLLGLVVTTDGPLVLCWTLAMWGCWEGWQATERGEAGWRWWLLAGAAGGLGLLSKYTMGAFALSALWLAWRAPRCRAGLLAAAGVGLLIVAPHIAWNALNGWPTLGHTADITVDAAPLTGLRRLASIAEFAAGQALMLGPVALIAGALLRRGAGVRPAAPSAYALACALPLLAIGLLQASHAKAQINWAAPFLAGACLWLALGARAPARPGGLVFAWIAGVFLGALVAQAAAWLPGPAGARADPWARMRGWQPALESMAPALQAHPGLPIASTDRTLSAHAAYVWRGLGREVHGWPPGGVPRNHYEQFKPLRAPGQPWPEAALVLVPDTPEAPVRAAYHDWVQLAAATRDGNKMTLWLASHPLETK